VNVKSPKLKHSTLTTMLFKMIFLILKQSIGKFLRFLQHFSERSKVNVVAIDGEFDQSNGVNVLSKITIVDEEGLILLDTLVNPG